LCYSDPKTTDEVKEIPDRLLSWPFGAAAGDFKLDALFFHRYCAFAPYTLDIILGG
jgi:hypothetical protein